MADKQIIDFTWHLNEKKKKQVLKEKIAASGWDIDNVNVNSVDYDFCIYIIDNKSNGILLFGCNRSEIPDINSKDIIHWGHFVQAWDVMADPKMPFDIQHKNHTICIAMRALPGLKDWPTTLEKCVNKSNDMKSHLLVIVDRNNFECPTEIIVAHSASPVMNEESIRSILDARL